MMEGVLHMVKANTPSISSDGSVLTVGLSDIHLQALQEKCSDSYSRQCDEDGVILRLRMSGNIILCKAVTFDPGSDSDHVNIEPVDDRILLWAAPEFFSYYNLQNGSVVTVEVTSLLCLSRVVLTTRSQSAFSTFNTYLNESKLIVGVCQGKVLGIQDHVLDLGRDAASVGIKFGDVVVAECYPVSVGYLHLSTEVTVRCDALQVSRTRAITQSQAPRCTNRIIMNFTALNRDRDDVDGSLEIPFTTKDTVKDVGRRLRLHPSVLWMPSQTMGADTSVSLDDSSEVAAVTQSTLQYLGLSEGAWIRISLNSRNKTTAREVVDKKSECARNHVVAQVVSCERVSQDCIISDELIYVTPSMWFNLNSHPSTLLMSPPQRVRVAPLVPQRMPHATEMHYSLVHSPTYPQSGSGIRDAVREYFTKRTRAVSIGHVVCIPGNPCYTAAPDESCSTYSTPVYYIKVDKLLPHMFGITDYRVNTKETKIRLAGTCQSYVPVSGVEYVLHKPATLLHSPVPPIYSRYVHKLVNILSAQLNNNSYHPLLLTADTGGSGKSLIVRAVAKHLNMHLVEENCCHLTGETSGACEGKIKQVLFKATCSAPAMLHLKCVDLLARNFNDRNKAVDGRVMSFFMESLRQMFDDVIRTRVDSRWPVLVICSSNSSSNISEHVISLCVDHTVIQPLTEGERRVLLECLCKEQSPRGVDDGLITDDIVNQTTSMNLSDLVYVVNTSLRNSVLDIYKHYENLTLEDELSLCKNGGVTLRTVHLSRAVSQYQHAVGDVTGRPNVPAVQWSDVGGLAAVKAEILNTIQLPLTHPALIEAGLKRSGVLLYGPPGTGKTLLAKAVATECQLNFLSVKGPELINKYVGQSEENIREVFNKARAASPCIIFFDELDSLAPSRGRSGDSGGVMDRVVSQLLAELDGLHSSQTVFVIGATNRPDLLDTALLRPGRFDKLLYVSISSDLEGQVKILAALTRKLKLAADVILEDICKSCPPNFTGADFYALCSDATLAAIQRRIAEHTSSSAAKRRSKDRNDEDESWQEEELVIEKSDFLSVLPHITPSVSLQDLQRYEQIKMNHTKQSSMS